MVIQRYDRQADRVAPRLRFFHLSGPSVRHRLQVMSVIEALERTGQEHVLNYKLFMGVTKLSQSAMKHLLRSLVDKKYLVRSGTLRAEHRSRVLMHLTPLGKRALADHGCPAPLPGHAQRNPTAKLCEVVLTCNLDMGIARFNDLPVCGLVSVDQRGGRYVCWEHRSAYDNPYRSRPLTFIELEQSA